MISSRTAGIASLAAAIGVLASPGIAQDESDAVQRAIDAMGVAELDAIMYYGSGANFSLGQSNNANGPWPRTNLNDYRRTIDFTERESLATAVTYAVPVTGGEARIGDFVQHITPEDPAWAQQLEIWTTPWGFLKGAMEAEPTVTARTIDGKDYDVVAWETPQLAPSGKPYTLVGHIDRATGLVDRVETWVENSIFGDLHVDTRYDHYRDNMGLKYPSRIVQKRAGWPTFEAQLLGADANPEGLDSLLEPPPRQAGGFGGGGQPPPHQAERLADGIYRITGGYVALAVEFADHILVYEPAGQNEARSASLLEEVKRAIPNKPIRYAVLSHHHFDHTGGLPAVVAEGATIVTHEVNRDFFESALNAPRTLAPDAMTRSGREPVIETVGDMRVFEDETRRVEIHHIKGLPHADGMLIAYVPEERIVAYADMFNLPPADDPVPDPPVVGTLVFADNLERLGLDWETLVTVHAPTPDRPITRSDLLDSIGRGE